MQCVEEGTTGLAAAGREVLACCKRSRSHRKLSSTTKREKEGGRGRVRVSQLALSLSLFLLPILSLLLS